MEIIAGTTDFYLEKDTAVAIGKFDGVHLGHAALLRRTVEEAARRGLPNLPSMVNAILSWGLRRGQPSSRALAFSHTA